MGSGAAAVGAVFWGTGVAGVFGDALACWLIFSTGRVGVANSRKRIVCLLALVLMRATRAYLHSQPPSPDYLTKLAPKAPLIV